MGGDASDSPGEPSQVQDSGSVGDWSLPRWVHRISGVAWLFVGLSVVDVLIEFLARNGLLFPLVIEPGFIVGLAGSAAVILIPAAVLWHTDRPRPPLGDPLVAGSIAVALGELARTSALALGDRVGPSVSSIDLGSEPVAPPVGLALRVVAIALLVGGPLLLGRAIVGLRHDPAPRWAIRAGIAIGVVTGLYIAIALDYFVNVVFGNGPALFDDLSFRWEAMINALGAFTLVGWAFLAWAVMSAAGDPARPRRAWRAAMASVTIRQTLMAVELLAMALANGSTSPVLGSAGGGLTTLAEWLNVAYFQVAGGLYLLSTILLVAAFATGLGRRPESDEPDVRAPGLEPVPIPR